MKRNLSQNRTSRIRIFACIVVLIFITLMSACSKAKIAGTLQLLNACSDETVKFTTEKNNVVMIGEIGPISAEMRTADFRNSRIDYLKNDSSARYLLDDLIPLCKEAGYDYFVMRFVDSISRDTMNITVPIEEL